jgi:hypothetical protein
MKDVHDKIEEDLYKVCEALGWESLYVEEYTEAAAVKASALFQALGYDYGDRIPSVYKLQDTIAELITSIGRSIIINTPKNNFNDLSSGTGMFTVQAQYDNEAKQWEFEIFFDLLSFSEHRIKE